MEVNVIRITDSAMKLMEDLGLERINRDSTNLKQLAENFAQDAVAVNAAYTGVLCFCLLELSGLVQEILDCDDATYAENKADFQKQLQRLYREIRRNKYGYRQKGTLEETGHLQLHRDETPAAE